MSRRRKILVADLLCGAGGSSTGCARALAELGLEMELVCVNHWGVAIETHRKNHPEARHYVQDISTVRPHMIVPEGYLDLLMASPTCTHHSVARGGKPTSDQQRSDPWHIITWLTELRVKRIIIENVWEFIGWGPVDHRTGKPIRSRKGEYFHAWIETIRRLGFEPEWRKLNAADFGDATTRQRFILMARSDRKRVLWPMPTHTRTIDGKLALFPGVKPWRPAREIIDWSIKGRSIFDRKKPLAPKTLARIYAGAVRFKWPKPFLVKLRNHGAAQSLDLPVPTITAGGTHIGLAEPILVKQHFRRDAQSVDEPAPTVTSVARIGLVEPFILNRASDGHGETRAHSIDEPAPTATTSGAGYVVEPFVLSRHGEGAPRSIEEPTPTQVAKHSHVLISPYYGSGSGETCQSADEPLPTITSIARFGMVVPITHTDRSNRARDLTEPLPTLTTANRGELAFIAAQFGERAGQAPRVHGIDQPTPTIAATGHVNLVEATPEFDILFRMLEPHELAAAMGFNDAEQQYEFAGTKTEKIKQIGNAVSVSKMKACVSAIMADAAPKTAAVPPELRSAAE
ncbi:DNA cytosine methyltransferase [Bradyrhizobium japonicum]|uniref:DNA cytosine methyltransferase n=1 Tax=Bradyrhizobium japonicum TaxID=375 RepID=UPI0003F908A3|nr:DNA cytosine methyltransferase [Bradyrhizobium japonicum]